MGSHRLASFSSTPLPCQTDRMNRALKTLLLWLLITALPVQGLAAVMKASCGPAHHSSLPIVIMAAADHHHGDATHAHHQHHHDAAMHSVADASASDSHTTTDGSSAKHESAYCSACAACCVGAVAPPPASDWTPTHSSSETAAPSPAPLVAGFIPDGLERPPRCISA
jgi:hypothetical protein